MGVAVGEGLGDGLGEGDAEGDGATVTMLIVLEPALAG